MTDKEKKILKALVEDSRGLLSPADFLNGIAGHDRRSAQNLIAMGYIEEVPQPVPDWPSGSKNLNFYRATHKGILKFYPWYRKFWNIIGKDIRTIIISVITAAVTTILTNLLARVLK